MQCPIQWAINIWSYDIDYIEDFDDNVYTHRFLINRDYASRMRREYNLSREQANYYTIIIEFHNMKTDSTIKYEKRYTAEELILITGSGYTLIDWYFNQLKRNIINKKK